VTDTMLTEADWLEVSRTAHQLALDHGQSAHVYAAKLAREAAKEGKLQEAEFWRAVSASLTPRA
jgi:hypothetical protein